MKLTAARDAVCYNTFRQVSHRLMVVCRARCTDDKSAEYSCCASNVGSTSVRLQVVAQAVPAPVCASIQVEVSYGRSKTVLRELTQRVVSNFNLKALQSSHILVREKQPYRPQTAWALARHC